jgi:hypothetical protein
VTSRDADDGDEADDAQLKSLRAVWLAMPDEEPPARGLDALMVAARARAEELATPPWWKRMLGMLARPPVLALATIMILVGGAVLISKRDDVKEAAPVYERAPASPATAPVAAPIVPDVPAGPMGGAAAGSAVHEREIDRDVGGKTREVKKPPSNPQGDIKKPAPKPVAPPPTANSPAHRPMPEPALEQLDRTSTNAPADSEATKGAEVQDDRPAEKSGGEAASTRAPAPKQVIVDQLLAQCRSAATRGDCEAARLIARRIAAQSTTYYRDHVASDAAIQKCIPAAQ